MHTNSKNKQVLLLLQFTVKLFIHWKHLHFKHFEVNFLNDLNDPYI